MGADYTLRKGKPVILLRARDADGKGFIFEKEGLRPYFWAPLDEVADAAEIAIAVDGKKVGKVYTGIPSEVREKRENYSKSYEADILFPWRFLIDKGIRYGFTIVDGNIIPTDRDNGQKMRRMYLDIEVEVTGNPIDPVAALDMILTIGYSIDGEATEILERCCNAFIQKPFRMNQLSQAIREILDKK